MRSQSTPVAASASVTLTADVTSLVAIHRTPSVAAGLADGHVALWNGTDASPAIVLSPNATRVLAVGATADGRFVVSLAADGSLARTAVAPGAVADVRTVDLGTAPTRAAVFSADSTRLITGGEFGDLRVFDTVSGALRHTLRGHRSELQDLAARPGSTLVASAGAEADVRVWDTATGAQAGLVDNDLSTFALAFSPVDGTLASGGPDRRATLRDARTFRAVKAFALKAPWMVATLAWSPDGRLLVVGTLDDATLARGDVQVVDASRLALVSTLDTGGVPVSRLACTAQGGRLVVAMGRQLRAWPLPTA